LAPSEFEPALMELIAPWLGSEKMLVVACGMVGSRQGWAEAKYAQAPSQPLTQALAEAPTHDSRISVRIVPGIRQNAPPDVMRGEETQIAGFLRLFPEFDGVLCLPGTHTKWVHISAGEVVSFRTFMTGELFSLLSERSVLRHSVTDGWDEDAFVEAVSESMSKPEAIAARLFSLRADDLLNATGSAKLKARLSGYLIGAELAGARPYWLGQNVALIGASALCKTYAAALAQQGLEAHILDGTKATQAGLAAARDLLEETVT
ncbi:MAG: 2-dehydro-3-deoxygalactonokinase, partial [Boseongicola sp.]|nr:2-dehydro-3-deoxygalactonokinase [Boseongicola sp.]